ncbi:MAG: sigma-70 family RNA polymerase sigma factor [Thermaerobacter sp.]|nr:sigma-70 family RNA polymerase sigma factor [Thermaerobacter sp.]
MSPRRAKRPAASQDWVQPFIEQWGAALVKFGAAYTGRREMAQDVAQDVFLRLMQWHDRYPDHEVRPGWLFTVARNAATDRLRKERSDALPKELSDPSPPFEDAVITRLDVRRVLDDMSEADRECLMLFYFGQWSIREVADHLNTSLDSVKTRLRRARKRFSDGWEAMRHD